MALPQSPISSSKQVASPQIKNQKKKKKAKRNLVESEQASGSTQQVAQQTPSSVPRKRTKSPGIRVVGGRIYDSENGKTCHQCRQKTMDFVAACKSTRRGKLCTIKFCHKCLLNRYGEKAEEMDKLDDWECPKCREICNCSFCMKKKGHQPTGILVHAAKATGFQSVSEMLIVNGPRKESSTEGKDDSVSHSKSLISPNDDNTKAKGHKRKKSDHTNTDNNVVSGGEEKKRKAKKSKKLVQTEGNVQEESKADGGQSEKNTNGPFISESQAKGRVASTEGDKKKVNKMNVVQKKHKKSRILKENTINPINTKENAGLGSTEDEKVKINEMNGVGKKDKKSRKHKKNILSSVNTEENGGIGDLEGKSMSATDCSGKTEPNADISLPEGIALTAVAENGLTAEDVGAALQFLEFCRAFGEILELKKGEPESVLRELTSGCNRRRRTQYSSVVRFHVQLLSLIQKDMGEECPLSPTSNGSSWFQGLGKFISDCRCTLKEMPLECFDRGGDGYERLDSSQRLRLLNFLCDEALCTADLRGWIDKQNETLVKREKVAKEMVLAAKDKERRLKQQMQDEIAKAIVSKSGAPLSVAEHQDLVSKIKSEAAKIHEEKLEAMGMVPNREQRSDAVRTEPVLLDENGRILWRLRGSGESSILLQEIGGRGSDKPEDKWFTFDTELQKAVESYISYQKKKRIRSEVLSDSCIEKGRKIVKKKKIRSEVLSDSCIEEGRKIVNNEVADHPSSNQSN